MSSKAEVKLPRWHYSVATSFKLSQFAAQNTKTKQKPKYLSHSRSQRKIHTKYRFYMTLDDENYFPVTVISFLLLYLIENYSFGKLTQNIKTKIDNRFLSQNQSIDFTVILLNCYERFTELLKFSIIFYETNIKNVENQNIQNVPQSIIKSIEIRFSYNNFVHRPNLWT